MHDTSWEPLPERSNSLLIRNWRMAQLGFHLLVGVMQTALLLPVVGRAWRLRLIRRWAVRILAIFNVSIKIQGTPPDTSTASVMFVANHISWLDIFLLSAVCSSRFVSKSEVRAWPVIGWLSAKVGTVFIQRTRQRDAARSTREVLDVLNQGDNVVVFPEGTTTDGTELLPFHASLLQSVISSDAQLWPVAIRYVRRDGSIDNTPAYIGDMSLGESLHQVLAAPELVAEIIYLEPLPIQGHGRRELAALAEKAIANALNLPVPCRKSGKSADPQVVQP